MIAFARLYPDYDETLSLAQSLSWTHMKDLIALKSDEARAFYAEEAATKHLSVAPQRARVAGSDQPQGLRAPRNRELPDPGGIGGAPRYLP